MCNRWTCKDSDLNQLCPKSSPIATQAGQQAGDPPRFSLAGPPSQVEFMPQPGTWVGWQQFLARI